jgi:hypothetical protein
MPEGIGSARVTGIAEFLEGLEELAASTGVTIAGHAPTPIHVENDRGDSDDGGNVWEVYSYEDTDGTTRYRVKPQPA